MSNASLELLVRVCLFLAFAGLKLTGLYSVWWFLGVSPLWMGVATVLVTTSLAELAARTIKRPLSMAVLGTLFALVAVGWANWLWPLGWFSLTMLRVGDGEARFFHELLDKISSTGEK